MLFIASLILAGPDHQSAASPDQATVRQFVQSFYDWYAPQEHSSLENQPVPSLGTKESMFSDELQTLMRQDRAAQKRMTLLNVGLYPDPFLLWLDPPKHYSVQTVNQKGSDWFVKVIGDVPKGRPVPTVTVKVIQTSSGLFLANFITDDRDNFLNSLRNLHGYLANVQSYIHGPALPSSPEDLASVRKFTQNFYSWYANDVAASFHRDAFGAHQRIDPEGDVLRKKRRLLNPKLYRLLFDDWDAQRHTSGYIVGIDMDPFLSSQDPDRYYMVRKIERHENRWYVRVSGGETKTADDGSQVIAVVEKTRHGWQFSNFIYDLGTDLVEILRETKEDRRKHPVPRDKE